MRASLFRSAVLSLAIVATVLSAAPAFSSTTCKSASCSTTCTPDGPVQISTLIDSGDWPDVGGTIFDTPVKFLDKDDGSGQFLVVSQKGAILVWDGPTDTVMSTPYLNLEVPVACCGERGLLSMVLDPDFVGNGKFYVFYTRGDGDIVIARYERDATDPTIADPSTELVLMVIDHPAGNHNGGDLAFGPDGFLYISTGDSGGSCDGNAGANGDGQQSSTLHGKLLRIDVNGVDPLGTAPDDCGVAGTGAGYTIPTSNPFAGQEPACDEVFTLGLRNPFRFSFDRLTGDVYIGDVGQNKWEEINLLPATSTAPVNFGWACREGCESSNNDESFCSNTGCPLDSGATCEFVDPDPKDGNLNFVGASGFTDPPLCHYNGGWGSIMGGYRYRGTEVPSLDGDYFYSDAFCGQIWKTTTLDPANPAAIDSTCWASGFGGTYGFAEDAGGELYVVVGAQDRIDCIHNGDGCTWAYEANPEIFSDGFETGNTTAWSSSTP